MVIFFNNQADYMLKYRLYVFTRILQGTCEQKAIHFTFFLQIMSLFNQPHFSI